jgi:LacI family transcriptional regulator
MRTEAIMAQAPEFSAVIGANIFMTIGAIRALRRQGRRIPDDVALVSFNDLDLAAEIDPFLTALSHPIYTMGRIAMGLLLDRIQHRDSGPVRDVVLSPSLIIRRSCGMPSSN